MRSVCFRHSTCTGWRNIRRRVPVRQGRSLYEIAEAIGCPQNKVGGIRERALAKCQRIAKYLKSRPLIVENEPWAYIMADPIETPQMEFLFDDD
ncbi:MAG: hypothetical protein OXI61_00635 [Candidatus Poribacteria bacterium]|nr:hypothetical protein [Candidatus Poribacteria bacterium]